MLYSGARSQRNKMTNFRKECSLLCAGGGGAFHPRFLEAEIVQGHLYLQSKFLGSLDYTEEPCLKGQRDLGQKEHLSKKYFNTKHAHHVHMNIVVPTYAHIHITNMNV